MPRLLPALFLMTALVPVAAARDAVPQGGGDTKAAFIVSAGDTLWLAETIEVIGSRVPAALPGVVRTVSLLTADVLERLPARSAAEALASAPAVAVGQRQQYGVQADLSIRGSTFEQVQVLFDGTDIGDPQTGHHSFDLPLPGGEAERIEVLRGHGSALYGANAFGGAVNVVPRRPAPVSGGSIETTGGGEGTWGVRAGLDSGPWAGGARTRLALETFRTDGDRPGTDVDNLGFSARTAFGSAGAGGDVFAGWTRREFGARDFYSPFPSWERTETLLLTARMRSDLSDRVAVEPRFSFRRHDDRFVLRRGDPDAYANDHRTDRFGFELRSAVAIGSGFSAAAVGEGVYEELDSEGVRRVDGQTVRVPALGDHRRRRAAAGIEIAGAHGPARWTAGARLDARGAYSPRLSRSAALNLAAGGGVDLRASAGTVFRVPTFTELYYEDPANLGDPQLAPERGWTWDLGLDGERGPWTMSWTFFERHEKDLIDWARPAAEPDSRWRAANIGSGRVRGLVQSMSFTAPRGHVFAVHYSLIRKRTGLPDEMEGKYDLVAPRQILSAQALLRFTAAVDASVAGRYRRRSDGSESFVVDLGMGVRTGGWRTRAVVTNLLDRDYQEVPGVDMPGSMITFTVGRSFGG